MPAYLNGYLMGPYLMSTYRKLKRNYKCNGRNGQATSAAKCCPPFECDKGQVLQSGILDTYIKGKKIISPRNTLVDKETLVNLWSAIPCNVIIAC